MSPHAWFLVSTVVSAAIIVLWELIQIIYASMTFDPTDIYATIAGALAWLTTWRAIKDYTGAP
jgi:CDP-diglyceride synthetase